MTHAANVEQEAFDALTGQVRVTARFVPEMWVRDNAMTVDPLGPDEWDATEAFAELPDAYRSELLEEMHDSAHGLNDGEALDSHDILQGDPNAPDWIRDWPGPFSLYVRHTETPSSDNTTSLPEHLQTFLTDSDYATVAAWAEDNDYLQTACCGWVDLDDQPIDIIGCLQRSYETATKE